MSNANNIKVVAQFNNRNSNSKTFLEQFVSNKKSVDHNEPTLTNASRPDSMVGQVYISTKGSPFGKLS